MSKFEISSTKWTHNSKSFIIYIYFNGASNSPFAACITHDACHQCDVTDLRKTFLQPLSFLHSRNHSFEVDLFVFLFLLANSKRPITFSLRHLFESESGCVRAVFSSCQILLLNIVWNFCTTNFLRYLTFQKSFFLTSTRAENIGFKSWSKTTIIFFLEAWEQSMVHFWL